MMELLLEYQNELSFGTKDGTALCIRPALRDRRERKFANPCNPKYQPRNNNITKTIFNTVTINIVHGPAIRGISSMLLCSVPKHKNDDMDDDEYNNEFFFLSSLLSSS